MILPAWARAALAAIFAAMVGLSALAWAKLPSDGRFPVHWGIDGQPDRFASKVEAVWMLPGLFLLTFALLVAFSYADPRRRNLAESAPTIPGLFVAIALFMLAVHATAIAAAAGMDIEVGRIIPCGAGLLFLVIGNWLAKVRSNFAFGIRTPWTLSSDDVWRRTHRLGGLMFASTGAATLIAGLLLPIETLLPILLVGSLATATITMLYSWWLYRREQDEPG